MITIHKLFGGLDKKFKKKKKWQLLCKNLEVIKGAIFERFNANREIVKSLIVYDLKSFFFLFYTFSIIIFS